MEQNAIEPDIRVTRERVREHERRADAGLGLDFGDWLLDAVWDLARNDLAEHPADDGEPVTVNWLTERFANAAVIADQRQHHGPRGRLTLGVSGGTNCLWLNGELIWVESHANYYAMTRGHFWAFVKGTGVPLRAGEGE